jgi:hypothetical protein
MPRRRVKLLPDYQDACWFTDPTLVPVVTLSEAVFMWGKSETAIMHQINKRQIAARRSVTGGEWLVSRVSLVKKYGQPKEDVVCQLLK